MNFNTNVPRRQIVGRNVHSHQIAHRDALTASIEKMDGRAVGERSADEYVPG